MEYLLSVGLDFKVSWRVLQTLKEKAPKFFQQEQLKQFMLLREAVTQSLELVEFDLKRAISSLREGQPVIPVWLDAIHQRLTMRLKEWFDLTETGNERKIR
ncbi:MAG: hypothetical protein WBB28_23940 [Crinalium sp.]